MSPESVDWELSEHELIYIHHALSWYLEEFGKDFDNEKYADYVHLIEVIGEKRKLLQS